MNYSLGKRLTKSGTMETELEFGAVDEDEAKDKYNKWGEDIF